MTPTVLLPVRKPQTLDSGCNQHRWFAEADRFRIVVTENARPDSNLDRHRSTLNDLPWTAVHLWLQGTGHGLWTVGPLSAVEVGGIVYWMGINQFFAFDGSVRPLIGPINNFVFQDINYVQIEKVVAGLDKEHNEVFWFYPTANSDENDRYCKFNYRENVWDVGTMDRTAWTDASTFSNNIGAGANNYLYAHELGVDADGEAMHSYIESADMDIGDGDEVMFIDRALLTSVLQAMPRRPSPQRRPVWLHIERLVHCEQLHHAHQPKGARQTACAAGGE